MQQVCLVHNPLENGGGKNQQKNLQGITRDEDCWADTPGEWTY